MYRCISNKVRFSRTFGIYMKIIIATFLILTSSVRVFSQTEVKLMFYDACEDSLVTLEYEAWNLENPDITMSSSNSQLIIDQPGTYLISSSINRGDLVSLFSFTIPIEGVFLSDTLEIPSLTFSVSGGLHDRIWIYQKCNKICEGTESSYYRNGNKQIEGVFEKGKPNELTTYRLDGTIELKEFFNPTIDRTRINYYNEQGKLYEYEIHKNSKNKTTISIFNSADELLTKRTEKHIIEK